MAFRFSRFYKLFSTLPRFWESQKKEPWDWLAPIAIGLLCILSIFSIYSAQSYVGGGKWMAQIVWILIGGGVYFVVSNIHYRFYFNYAHFFYLFSLILLLLLWTPMGVKIYGALRWLDLKVCTIQPSEAAKIGTLILTAAVLTRSRFGALWLTGQSLLLLGGIFLLPMVLIFLQPDLGSCLVFPPMLFGILYLSPLSRLFFLFTSVVVLCLIGLVSLDTYLYAKHIKQVRANSDIVLTHDYRVLPLKDYQRKRILTFVAPQIVDPQGLKDNWNLRQSLISIGSGGFFGQGFNNGTQAKLGYLPQAVSPNDFIFAVIGEEFGFIGASSVLFLYALILLHILRTAQRCSDRFGLYLAVGISIIFVIHIFVNIGMTLGVAPITGLPLPFLSYGGTFLVSCCALLGIVQSINRFRHDNSL